MFTLFASSWQMLMEVWARAYIEMEAHTSTHVWKLRMDPFQSGFREMTFRITLVLGFLTCEPGWEQDAGKGCAIVSDAEEVLRAFFPLSVLYWTSCNLNDHSGLFTLTMASYFQITCQWIHWIWMTPIDLALISFWPLKEFISVLKINLFSSPFK